MADDTPDNPKPWCPLCSKTLFPPVTFVQGIATCHAACVTEACQDVIATNAVNPEGDEE